MLLFARKLSSSPAGNHCMLAVGPNPDLGLSLTPISDHSFATVDELCEFIDKSKAMKAPEVEALRRTMDAGEQLVAQISDEKERCMGSRSNTESAKRRD